MSTVDEILKGISASAKTTKESIEELKNLSALEHEEYPQIIKDILAKSGSTNVEGVSLLALKNNSLVSYLNSVALVILSHLERLEHDENRTLTTEVIKNSVVQRVTLEKGIKPLEKKLNYQLDKMVRSYNRMKEDEQKLELKLAKNDDKSGSESDSDSDSEDDNLSYKPDINALAKMTGKSGKKRDSSKTPDEESKEKYRPPKILAIAPPVATAGRDIDAKDKSDKHRKLQSMEEYLREQSDLPSVESSIGSTIVNHGRGGVKTAHDKKKEQEIQTYEESNFTRLPNSQTKKNVRQQQRDMANTFGGEDWSMFSQTNNRNITTDTSRKRKSNSVWDRVKKKRS